MLRLPTWVLACSLFVLLPGCLSDGGSNASPEVPDPNNPPTGSDPTVHDGSGTVSAGAGTPVVSFTNGAAGATFSVPANATLLYIEMAWESAAVALDLCVHAPSDGDNQGIPICGTVEDGGSPGSPKSPVTYTLQAPGAGAGWTASPFPDGPAANQPFELKVTLFFGDTALPTGYSALA